MKPILATKPIKSVKSAYFANNFTLKKAIFRVLALVVLLIMTIIVLTWLEKVKVIVINQFPYVPITQISTQPHTQDLPSLSHYPVDLINMVLAVEDQTFLRHQGIDFIQIIYVIKEYLLDDKQLRGASTISQQLVKNGLLSQQRTLKRKLLEVVMVLVLEQYFTKYSILANYLDIVFLGQSKKGSIYGFIDASRYYFNKNPAQLNLEEMAQLVALLRGASYYHPNKHKNRLEKRKQLVLKIFKSYQKYEGKYTRD